jgi:hypothetical protein
MNCAACRREFGYEGWFTPDKRRVCSYRCLNLVLGGKIMVDKSPLELSALDNASVMGGEYLESIRKTDLMTMSLGEWMTFVEVICTGWEDGKQQANHRFETDLDRLTDPPFPS